MTTDEHLSRTSYYLLMTEKLEMYRGKYLSSQRVANSSKEINGKRLFCLRLLKKMAPIFYLRIKIQELLACLYNEEKRAEFIAKLENIQ